MKRAAKRRRRNAPPGPCGVLWEMSRSKVPKSKLREEEEEIREDQNNEGLVLFPNNDGEGSNPNDKNNNLGGSSKIGNKKKKKNRGNGNGNDDDDDEEQYDVSTPPAWMAMQRSLNIVTPYLPLWTRGNSQKRYERLRPHLPQNCILLPEILRGSHDLKISDDHPPNNLYLCVWVDSIEERNSHHGIWTVELKDETGATIRAWMEPNFVKEELQKAQQAEETSSNKGVVRVGVVWMLTNVSMIAINTNNNNNSSSSSSSSSSNTNNDNNNGGVVERMLVVSRKHILRMWTPELDKAQNQPNEEEDSPEAQRKYLDWMEKRNALTIDNRNSGDKNDDDDDDADADDDDGSPEKEEDELMEEEGHGHHHDSALDRQQEAARIRRSDDEQITTPTTTNSHRSRRRIVGGKEHQERMIEMSALTMTAADDECVIRSSQYNHTTANNGGDDGCFSATNGPNELGMQPTTRSPLAHRKVNPEDSSRITVNNNNNSSNARNNNKDDDDDDEACDDENHPTPSVLLYTQESSQAKDKMRAAQQQQQQQHSQLYRDSSQQHDDQLLTQPYPAQRNNNTDKGNQSSTVDRDIASSPGLSPHEHPVDPSIGRTHNKRKNEFKKTEDAKGSNPIQDRARNTNSPKRTRENRGSTCSNPIRMSQAVWNTPDPSILEMLEEEDSDGSVEEEEVKTVIWETPSYSFFPTQSSNKKQQHLIVETGFRGETEIRTQGGSKGNESRCIEEDTEVRSDQNNDDETNGGDESPLLAERASLGENLFEPSNWEGVDVAAAFNESDCE
jgi:hypothetical protein